MHKLITTTIKLIPSRPTNLPTNTKGVTLAAKPRLPKFQCGPTRLSGPTEIIENIQPRNHSHTTHSAGITRKIRFWLKLILSLTQPIPNNTNPSERISENSIYVSNNSVIDSQPIKPVQRPGSVCIIQNVTPSSITQPLTQI